MRFADVERYRALGYTDAGMDGTGLHRMIPRRARQRKSHVQLVEEVETLSERVAVLEHAHEDMRRRLETAEELLARTALETAPKLRELLFAVADEFDEHPRALVSPRRSAPIARARQAFYLLALEINHASTTLIGRAAGGRDHTTVVHGIKKAREREAREIDFAERMARLRLRFARESAA